MKSAFYIWHDGHAPCSMAATAGPTPNGIRINRVYTPPEFRSHGFASNLVAAQVSTCSTSAGDSVFFSPISLIPPPTKSISGWVINRAAISGIGCLRMSSADCAIGNANYAFPYARANLQV